MATGPIAVLVALGVLAPGLAFAVATENLDDRPAPAPMVRSAAAPVTVTVTVTPTPSPVPVSTAEPAPVAPDSRYVPVPVPVGGDNGHCSTCRRLVPHPLRQHRHHWW